MFKARPGRVCPGLMVSVTTLQKLALTTHCSLNLNEDTCTALLHKRLTESCKSDRPFSLYFLGPSTYFIPMFLCCEYLPLCACQAGSGRQLAPCACLPTSKTRGEQRRRRLTLSCSSAAPASASSRSRRQSPPSVSTSRSRGSGATRAKCQISVNSFPNSENRDGKSFYML